MAESLHSGVQADATTYPTQVCGRLGERPAASHELRNRYGQVDAIILTLSTLSFGAFAAEAAGG